MKDYLVLLFYCRLISRFSLIDFRLFPSDYTVHKIFICWADSPPNNALCIKHTRTYVTYTLYIWINILRQLCGCLFTGVRAHQNKSNAMFTFSLLSQYCFEQPNCQIDNQLWRALSRAHAFWHSLSLILQKANFAASATKKLGKISVWKAFLLSVNSSNCSRRNFSHPCPPRHSTSLTFLLNSSLIKVGIMLTTSCFGERRREVCMAFWGQVRVA